MDNILMGPVIVGAVILGVAVIRARQHRGDAIRRREARESYEERQKRERSDRSEASVAQMAGRFFPFAVPTLKNSRGGGDAKARLREILATTPGIELGTASLGLPAILPVADRRKHLIVLGKSGFGKTTIGLRLIRDDLREGRGLCILGSEAELFRDWLLPLVPRSRAGSVIYFRPADPECPLTWNPLSLEDGEDQALAAGQLSGLFKRAVAAGSIGPRADAILNSCFAVLVGRTGATLWSVTRLIEDERYRTAILADVEDPYLVEFWSRTFPGYPAGAALPLANRLNQFLRLPQLRASLCHPQSSFSIREALANDKILLFDVSGVDVEAARLMGQMLLGKFQLELMRREQVAEEDRRSVHVFVDEFHVFADSAEGTWRELLARGRRYGLGLHLFTQHPNQLPRSLQQEIFGNVSSVVALNLAAGDAAGVRRELLAPAGDDVLKPIPTEEFISLPVGEGYARLGSGACALRVKFAPPIDKPVPQDGDWIRAFSWKTYASPPLPPQAGPVRLGTPAAGTALQSAPPTGNDRSDGRGPGRGGDKHVLLQQLVRQWGEERGFRAVIEQPILGGAGRVDVVLERSEQRIAVEVVVASSAQQAGESFNKALAAGFGLVVLLFADAGMMKSYQPLIVENLAAADKTKVHLLTAEGFLSFLDAMSGGPEGERVAAGYRVRIERDPTAPAGQGGRRRSLARVVGRALLRGGWSS